jgi:alkylhydroperoxidase family enzyme
MQIPTDGADCKEVITSIQQQLSLTENEAASVLLTLAVSYSPSQVNDAVLDTVLKHMEPAGIVEIVVWLSVLQLLNRLSSYYTLIKT